MLKSTSNLDVKSCCKPEGRKFNVLFSGPSDIFYYMSLRMISSLRGYKERGYLLVAHLLKHAKACLGIIHNIIMFGSRVIIPHRLLYILKKDDS